MIEGRSEYVVRYGAEGFLGRFAAAQVVCRRGDRVVVRGHRGVELGAVLCVATPGHASYLPANQSGELLRLSSVEDEALADGGSPFEKARGIVAELSLPANVVDVEILLEPRTLVLHYLRTGSGSLRPLVQQLGERFAAMIELQDLRLGIATDYGDQHHERYCASDKPKAAGGCGSGGGCGGGGCGSGGCGSGGCGGGSCSTGKPAIAAAPHDDLLLELGSKLGAAVRL